MKYISPEVVVASPAPKAILTGSKSSNGCFDGGATPSDMANTSNAAYEVDE